MEEELLYECMGRLSTRIKAETQPKQYKAPLVLYTGVDCEGLNSAVTTTIYHMTRHIGCNRR
jgi:hypothetical protein